MPLELRLGWRNVWRNPRGTALTVASKQVSTRGSPPFVQFTSNACFGGSRVVTRSEKLTGVMLGYDFTPEVRGEPLAICDWTGTSASFFPIIR